MYFEFYIFLGLLFIGYIVGQFLESRHFRSINEREQGFLELVAVNSREPLGDVQVLHTELVRGSCCISIDYFKRIVTGLRKLFGGNVRSYETLLDRARREAVLRLKESCPGAEQIINLRIETSSITKGQAQQTSCVEVHAYGTAIYSTSSSPQSPTGQSEQSFPENGVAPFTTAPVHALERPGPPQGKPSRKFPFSGKRRRIDRDP